MSRNLQRITLDDIKAVKRGDGGGGGDGMREAPGASLLPFFSFFHASRAPLERGGRGDDLKATLPCDELRAGSGTSPRVGGWVETRCHWCMMGKSVTVNQRE